MWPSRVHEFRSCWTQNRLAYFTTKTNETSRFRFLSLLILIPLFLKSTDRRFRFHVFIILFDLQSTEELLGRRLSLFLFKYVRYHSPKSPLSQ